MKQDVTKYAKYLTPSNPKAIDEQFVQACQHFKMYTKVVEKTRPNSSYIKKQALNRRFLSGVWTVNSPQSHIVRVYDAGHGKSGVFHSAEWHDGDWSSDGILEAWLWFFIWEESF
ncbi:uncharacterized protein TNCV_518961 [Trichonephila clavipes]|nr:uncharacterized protein TNCV_518961 [Trichonephila clavipes]